MAFRGHEPKHELLWILCPAEALPVNRLCYVAEERQ